MRTAFEGTYTGTVVGQYPTGVRLKLAGSKEVVFVEWRFLDPKGWKAPRKPRAASPKPAPKARKALPSVKRAMPRGERLEYAPRVVGDLTRYGHGISIGKMTVSR